MTFEKLVVRANLIAVNAAGEAQDRLMRTAILPAGVTAERAEGGIVISGKRLRRQMITDPQLRNFGR